MGTYFWERVDLSWLNHCLVTLAVTMPPVTHLHSREATLFETRPMLVAGRRSREDRKPALHLSFLGLQAGGAGRDRHGWTTWREFISDARSWKALCRSWKFQIPGSPRLFFWIIICGTFVSLSYPLPLFFVEQAFPPFLFNDFLKGALF